MRTCAICGSPFEVGPHNRKRKYCSDKCSDKHKHPGKIGRPPTHGRRRGETTRMELREPTPAYVWEERELALREPRSLTQLWFGDPPLCRSALSRS